VFATGEDGNLAADAGAADAGAGFVDVTWLDGVDAGEEGGRLAGGRSIVGAPLSATVSVNTFGPEGFGGADVAPNLPAPLSEEPEPVPLAPPPPRFSTGRGVVVALDGDTPGKPAATSPGEEAAAAAAVT